MRVHGTEDRCRCGCGAPVKPGHRFLSGAHLRTRFSDTERFWLNVDQGDDPDGCWIWTGAVRSQPGRSLALPYEYGVLMIDGRTVAAHRWAYRSASGLVLPDDVDVGHTCDVTRCVRNDTLGSYEIEGRVVLRYGHLFAGPTMDNMRDMAQKGRADHGPRPPTAVARGERSGRAMLTDDQIREIRRLWDANVGHMHTPGRWTLQRLADRYGVSTHTISMICLRQTWKHID